MVCGDLAIGGSSTCAQESAVLGFVNDEGLAQLDLVVAAPPRPCPCVIRLASYNGPVVAVDIPFVVTGHPVGTPPAPILPSALLTVTDVEVQGDTGIGSWFGASPTRQLVHHRAQRRRRRGRQPRAHRRGRQGRRTSRPSP